MLLTLTTTHTPASDLGFLLHKNPGRAQSFDLSFGQGWPWKASRLIPACSSGGSAS